MALLRSWFRAIARRYPGQRGFTRLNQFRMRQFFETYRDDQKVSPLETIAVEPSPSSS